MGYEREDAVYALKISNNHIQHAATFLMNNPRPATGNGRPQFRIGIR